MRRNLLKMTVATGALLLASCNPASSPDIPPMNALTALTGATLTDMQRAYDVQHYTIDVGVYPETKRIDGSVAVRFTALEPLSALELDLDPRMAVTAATRGDAALSFTHDSHKVTVQLDAPLAAGETATVTLTYGGKPHIGIAPPWQGGLVWSTTEDGLPWVATAVQGEGCDLWWPCKDHYADKPDAGMDIIINVPDTVKVAANGVLAGQSDIKDGRHSFHWKTNHPITGYAAAINIGPYTRLTDSYVGINGTTMPIEFWVLPEDAQAAETLITSDIKSDLAFFEKLLGPYPWGDEKVGFVQTPHLGMEHQTINAYGADFPRDDYAYDNLLHHELAHEWFGNVMTHARAADAWLHEGYASHMQGEYARVKIGEMAYAHHLFRSSLGSEHCDAIVDPTKDSVEDFLGNGDIYTKGSWLIHVLRQYMGDEAFWAGTRELLYDTAEPWDLPYPIKPIYRSTEDFIEIMSAQAGEDIRWIVEAYVLAADIPTLETTRTDGTLNLRWNVPEDRPFPMAVTVSVDGKYVVVPMPDGAGSLDVPEGASITLDPEMDILRRMDNIGDCSEREAADAERIQKRYDAMAIQYRWQRE